MPEPCRAALVQRGIERGELGGVVPAAMAAHGDQERDRCAAELRFAEDARILAHLSSAGARKYDIR
jgi:hypothetical protein